MEIPLSVSNLFVVGEVRIRNFVKYMFPFNVRKDMENSLPATFQLWDIPEIRKCLDKNIHL